MRRFCGVIRGSFVLRGPLFRPKDVLEKMFKRISGVYRDAVAVVVGAGGIGFEIASKLAAAGAKIVVADRSDEQLRTVTAALATSTSQASVQVRKLDVCDEAEVTRVFADITATVGVPQFLFYTAGILNLERLADTTNSQWERAIDINLNGVFRCVQAVAGPMSERGRGSILILGSIAGTKARSGSRVNPVYNTTKAGVAAFVNAAAMQLRPSGVRINCISPGPTATPMMDQQPAQLHEAVRTIALDGRMNEPSEVAELALFVAGHGRFTGEDLGLGGGAGLGG